ncbi:SgcJ/EcaC family oxidoreductase [Streptomyces sp. NPDC057496]|uniref:SgcJ/EcaC family oxidoreductase n=1 Tax=Streptomyces sp. NPDC057496 TaxID=3346149 RepID=UPI0036A05B96
MTSDILVVGTISPEILAAVTGVVKGLEKAFNEKDPVALGGQYAENASWTNAKGTRLDGRTAIVEFSAPALKSFLRDSFARYDVAKMLAIAPGVIAVNVVQTPTDSTGEPADGPWGATLYVIAEQPDGWRIVAGQNMAVAPPAQTA